MKVCRVSFKKLGKRYYFNPNNLNLKANDAVIVETIKGLELGFVQGDLVDIEDDSIEIKDILRLASPGDLEQYQKNIAYSIEVEETTKKLVNKLKLNMKVLNADFTLDTTKVTIYFESEDRVDFRELVKLLAEQYHCRIELRQVGSRDGAKVFGGIGPCGLIICCKTFITEFDTITVKMAKNQNLALNPLKISGNCGKLLCCIGYEDKIYTELRKNAPEINDLVEYKDGVAKVLSSDPLNKMVHLQDVNTNAYLNLKYEDITIIDNKKRNHKNNE